MPAAFYIPEHGAADFLPFPVGWFDSALWFQTEPGTPLHDVQNAGTLYAGVR